MSSQVIDTIFYTFTFQPILTNGDSVNGNYLILGDGQKVDKITIQMIHNVQQSTLSYQNQELQGYSGIRLMSFNVTNNIFSPVGNHTFKFIIETSDNIQNTLDDPILNIFREVDIITLSMQSYYDDAPIPIATGSIENIRIQRGAKGTTIDLNVGYLTNILARSQLVQTTSEQNVAGNILSAYAPIQTKFGTFLNGLLNETYIKEVSLGIKYYGGENEIIASGKASSTKDTKGSAINANSYVFFVTPPTDTKLNILLKTLYPYQRVFYIDTSGNLIITPLQIYYDNNESWKLTMHDGANPENGDIPIQDIIINKNTTIIQNRCYATLQQSYIGFIQAQSTNSTTSAVSLATPLQKNFPRAYDMIQSNLGLQTSFVMQSLDATAMLQNSGLLNTAININNLAGTKLGIEISNDNANLSSNSNSDAIKYILSLYAGRKLAENLVNDLLVDVQIPTVLTYNNTLSRFRNIPLNQMVKVPSVNNNLFDNVDELFCYGFNLSFDGSRSITTLNLCKPYVFTAFWVDKIKEI
jgi:hypothetical protein